jgi:peptide-methionine (S)-S-oxide reductase
MREMTPRYRVSNIFSSHRYKHKSLFSALELSGYALMRKLLKAVDGTFGAQRHRIFMENLQSVVLGGGCFWCLEAVFDRMEGVTSVESGYMGGHVDQPTYRQVCDGDTGHVEVVRVTFDPAIVTFREILDVFFSIHDPTTLNRQGNDMGTQYRSAIFYSTEEQYRESKKVIDELNAKKTWPNPIVTSLEPVAKFFVAEDYHQEYFVNNGNQPYCQFVVAPKVKKFEQEFAQKIKA